MWTLAQGQLPGKVTGWVLALFFPSPSALSTSPHPNLLTLNSEGVAGCSPVQADHEEHLALSAYCFCVSWPCLFPFSLLGNSEKLLLFLPMTLSLFWGYVPGARKGGHRQMSRLLGGRQAECTEMREPGASS